MTREEILAMEPGRELDMLVGQHVMGLRVDPVVKTHLVAGYDDPEGWADPDSIWEPVPHYSTDIAAAWQIAEKFIADGWNFEIAAVDIYYRNVAPGLWRCVVGRPTGRVKNQYQSERTFGSTAPEAICKAALLAVMGSDA